MNYLPYRDGESKTEPMNQLKKEILEAIEAYPATRSEIENWDLDGFAEAAAGIALKWTEKALRDTSEHTFTDSKGKLMRKVQDFYVAAWMEENGLKIPEV